MRRGVNQAIRGTAVIYLRAATVDQAEQAEAIEAQRAVCQCEAIRRGVETVAEFVDRGASGNDRGRGGLQCLLDFVSKRGIDYVIVRDHVRLSRNLVDGRLIRQTIERAGTAVVAVNDGGDRLALANMARLGVA